MEIILPKVGHFGSCFRLGGDNVGEEIPTMESKPAYTSGWAGRNVRLDVSICYSAYAQPVNLAWKQYLERK